jgi:hypothetical protein
MEDLEKMYIVKLLSGSVIKTGSFLAVDENDIKYFATEYFQMANKNVFLEFEKNGNEKFAVVVDEAGGPGRWEGYTFRNIQFISSNKEFCEEYKILKNKELKFQYSEVDLTEILLNMLRTSQDQVRINNLKNVLSVLKEELKEIKFRLEKLNQNNF